jgi:hypothetical protein
MFSVESRIGKAPKKAPNPKLQNEHLKRCEAVPTPTRVVERASYADFGIWNLEFLWSLELGAWSLSPSPLSVPPKTPKNRLTGF